MKENFITDICKKHNSMFAEFHKALLAQGVFLLLESEQAEDLQEGLLTAYLELLIYRLAKVSTRILIKDMYECTEIHQLKGCSDEEKFQEYIKRYLSNPLYRKELFDKYPQMDKILTERMKTASQFFLEFIERFSRDENVLGAGMGYGCSLSDLKRLNGDFSDSHNGGKTVLQVCLNKGKEFFYKPHQVKSEAFFYELYNFFLDACNLGQCVHKILDRGCYGWEEKIIYRPCADRKELARYYQRVGVLLFLTYMLGTTDLHCENLIADGEYPMIVDVETLLSPQRELSSREQFQSGILDNTVLQSGLLPDYMHKYEGILINVSGISGRAGETMPFRIPYIKNAGTMQMRISYRPAVSRGGSNLATLSGEFISPSEFQQEMLWGFETAYQVAIKNKAFLVSKTAELFDIDCRLVIRDSQQYAMLMEIAYHPDVMETEAARISIFGNLNRYRNGWNNDEAIVRAEIRQMMEGDIPYFYYKPEQKSLFEGGRAVVQDYFVEEPVLQLKKRIGGLCQNDLENQKSLLRLSLLLLGADEGEMLNTTVELPQLVLVENPIGTEKPFLQAAEGIAQRIMEKALHSANGEKICWLNPLFSRQMPRISKTGSNFYDGIPGICVFFTALARHSNDLRWKQAAEMLEDSICGYLEASGSDQKGYGIFEGYGSLVYACQLLFTITGKAKFLEHAKRGAGVLLQIPQGWKETDIISGRAGVMLVLQNMYQLTGDSSYLKAAEECADLLIRLSVELESGIGWPDGEGIALAGFAHGNSGIAYAFYRLAEVTRRQEYYEIAGRAIKYEESLYSQKWKNWPDLRESKKSLPEKERMQAVAWCHGAAGILMARSRMSQSHDVRFRQVIEEQMKPQLADKILETYRKGFCLCHGNCGNLEILKDHSRIFHLPELEDTCNSLLLHTAEDFLEDKIPFLVQEEENMGFMNGLSGIGYSFLRCMDSSLPLVLGIDI